MLHPPVYVCLPFNSMTNVFLLQRLHLWRAGRWSWSGRPPAKKGPPPPRIKISLVSRMLPQYQWWWWLLPVLVPHVVLETTGLEEGLMDPHRGFGTRKPDQDALGDSVQVNPTYTHWGACWTSPSHQRRPPQEFHWDVAISGFKFKARSSVYSFLLFGMRSECDCCCEW